MKIQVKVTPNAKKTELLAIEENIYKIRLKSPPVDGKANLCLIDFLAKYFKVRKNKIKIISGETARFKLVEVIDYENITNK